LKYSFSIPIKPVAKQSFRAVAVKRGKVHGFTPENIADNKLKIQKHVISQLPKPYRMLMREAYITRLHFVFKRPELMARQLDEQFNSYIPKTTKPDIDNLVKQLFDSIKGIVIVDDNIVVHINDLGKFYGKEDMIILDIEGK